MFTKMIRIISLILILININFGFSQDIIEMKSGDKLKVKIVEDLELKVRYRKYKEQDGPIYVLYKKEIKSITFEDGKKLDLGNKTKSEEYKDEDVIDETIIGPEAEVQRIKEKSILYNKKRHLIGYNYAQMILLNFEFTYEFILTKTGFLSLKIPLSIGMNLRNTYMKRNNLFSTGLQFNIYPTGQGRVAYLTGPSFKYALMQDNPGFYNGTVLDATRSNYLGFYINNGVLFQATSFLNFSLGLGLGTRMDLNRDDPAKFDISFDGSIIFRL